MKGIVLAGGNGTRLMPLTAVTNKSLLPVYDRPMIDYPLQLMRDAGIDEALIITGGRSCGDMMRVLGNGSRLGFKNLYFTVQEEALGISHALSLAEAFAANEKVFVVLGDNLVFGSNVAQAVDRFRRQSDGACVFLKTVPDPERFGIAELSDQRVVSLVEKPQHAKSNWAVTGLYLFDGSVFDRIRQLKPSARGELEVTDLNRLYLDDGKLTYELLHGDWIDAGTVESLAYASDLARTYATPQVLAA